MNPDEIYLANFPFGGSAGMKLRPVLLLTGPVGSVPEVLVAYISSVMRSPLLPSDLVLDPATAEHASTNLKTKSVVRLHKLAQFVSYPTKNCESMNPLTDAIQSDRFGQLR